MTLDQPARVQFSFTHTISGRRIGGKCLPQTNANRLKLRCQRTVTVAIIRFKGHAGRNMLHFEGCITRKHKLAPGSYKLTVVATANGHRSRSAILHFTILG